MIKRHSISFKAALIGIVYALNTQPNFKIHLILSSISIIGAILFHISTLELLILILTISIGLSIELINTAIESTVDLVTKEWHPIAKIAKDTSAAAMLVFAFGAVLIAFVIFLPKILSLWNFT